MASRVSVLASVAFVFDSLLSRRQGPKHARRFNRGVFARLYACVEKSLMVSERGGHTEPKGSREAIECSREKMTVILLGGAKFGQTRGGEVGGDRKSVV